MANLLTIKKEDNETFSFVVNGITADEVLNNRNDLFTFGNECHFKTSNGANIIKTQQILFNNISLFNGVTPIATPTSTRDLFDKLTALGFFDWYKTGGGGGVNRFLQLLDTFNSFNGKAGMFLVVADDELQLTTIEFTQISKSTDLTDFPDVLVLGKIAVVVDNGSGLVWELQDKPAGSSGLNQEFIYEAGETDPPVFELGTSALLSAVSWNGSIMRKADWTQEDSQLTINFTPDSTQEHIFQPIGNI